MRKHVIECVLVRIVVVQVEQTFVWPPGNHPISQQIHRLRSFLVIANHIIAPVPSLSLHALSVLEPTADAIVV